MTQKRVKNYNQKAKISFFFWKMHASNLFVLIVEELTELRFLFVKFFKHRVSDIAVYYRLIEFSYKIYQRFVYPTHPPLSNVYGSAVSLKNIKYKRG